MEKAAAAAAALLLLLVAVATAARVDEQQCGANLLPCSQYLNATGKPPEPCCQVLRSEVENELPCLCAILNNSVILSAFNMSSDRAFQFASDCGVTNTSVCSSSASGGSTYFKNSIGLPASVSLLLCWLIGVV